MGEGAVEAGLDQARLFAGGLGPRPLLQRMQILGDIAEMQKIAKGANDRQRLLGREVAQQLIELAVGLEVAKVRCVGRSQMTPVPGGRAFLGRLVAACGDREAADRLDALESLVALMLAHRLAEEPAQEPHISCRP